MLSSFCKKIFRRNSFLLNLMISILGLICVPLIAVQIFTVIRTGNEFDREIREHYRGTLKSLASSFEDQLQNISVASTNIKYNDELMQPHILLPKKMGCIAMHPIFSLFDYSSYPKLELKGYTSLQERQAITSLEVSTDGVGEPIASTYSESIVETTCRNSCHKV